MRSLTMLVSLCALCCWSAVDAAAGPAVERITARGAVRCGGVERPGLAEAAPEGKWQGLEVDVCRAVATAVLGSPERIQFRDYDTDKAFAAIRSGDDDLFFLTGGEIVAQNLAGAITPGPTVFIQSQRLMVADDSPVRHVEDAAGETICFMIGSPAERSVEAYFGTRGKSFFRRPFSEDGEMVDTYIVQHCKGVAGELTTLATFRNDQGVKHLTSRILPEPLLTYPIIAATGTGDAQWAALVAWTVNTLISAERRETQWYGGGVKAMPVAAPELGLADGWQQKVLEAVGNYGDLYARNLGAQSPLKLEREFNTNQANGGLLLSPFTE